jgi:sugar lactone lactonase YvrE
MYIAVDDNGEDVKEYDLSSAWDVSTASYVQRFILSSQIIYPFGLFFKPDGTKMYVSDPSSQDINEYSLSSAWNISTASYTQSFSVSGNISFNTGLFFKPDGTKMYVVDYIIGDVNEYSLSSAWDIATASYTQNFSISGQETLATGLFFDSSGSKMFITGQSGDDVNEYSLSSAWNISTASYIRNFSVASQASSPTGISFKPDGTKMYIVGSVTDTVYQYTTGTFGGFTTNSSYFVADDGSLTITNNGRKIGKALSASELQVKTKLTGSEMNEYLGGLV